MDGRWQILYRHCQQCDMVSVGESHEEAAQYHDIHMMLEHSSSEAVEA